MLDLIYRYKKYVVLILVLLIQKQLSAQSADTTSAYRFGVLFSYDLSLNLPNKVLNKGLERKMSLGVRYLNKERTFMAFAAAGFKGFKINAYSPQFQKSFISDLQSSYTPIQNSGKDSLVGALMNNGGNHMWGTYAQYLHFGIGLLNRFRTTLDIYLGREIFLLHDGGFWDANTDIEYVGMNTYFYEIKLGFAIPIKDWYKSVYSPNISIGYEWVDYGGLKFDDTPMEKYTSPEFVKKYNYASKITVSLTFYLWNYK